MPSKTLSIGKTFLPAHLEINQATLKQTIINECSFFSGLTPSSKERLSELLTEKKVTRGQSLFLKGDTALAMYFIAEGAVDICIVLEDGKKVSLNRLAANQFFGEISMLDGNLRTSDATAISNTSLFQLSRADFQAVSDNFTSQEWHFIVVQLCALLRQINNNLEAFVWAHPVERLVKKLLALPRTNAVVEVSQTYLAEMINLSRESTNKLLADLERQGLIETNYGKIRIVDEHRLLLHVKATTGN